MVLTIVLCVLSLLVVTALGGVVYYNRLSKPQLVICFCFGMPILSLAIAVVVKHDEMMSLPIIGAILSVIDDLVKLFISYVQGAVVPLYLWIGLIPTFGFVYFAVKSVFYYRKKRGQFNAHNAKLHEKELEELAKTDVENKQSKDDVPDLNIDENSPAEIDDEPVTLTHSWTVKITPMDLLTRATTKTAYMQAKASDTALVDERPNGYVIICATVNGVADVKKILSQNSVSLDGILNEPMIADVDVVNDKLKVQSIKDYVNTLGG